MPYSSSPAPNSTPSVLAAPANRVEPSINSAQSGALVGCLAIAIALSLALLSLGYRRYRVHQRSQLLKRQVAMLEAMWRISSTK